MGTFVLSKDHLGPLAASLWLCYGHNGKVLLIRQSNCAQNLKEFCNSINALYGSKYLQKPEASNLTRILDINSRCGFPGCIGSLDCMHWAWKNCPSAMSGQYKGKEKRPTIVFKAVSN
jgi:hypothetical protein